MSTHSTLPTRIPLFRASKSYTYKEFQAVEINHDLPLEEMIAEGEYSAKSPIISSPRIARSGLTGIKYYDLKLFSFLNEQTTEEIKNLILADNSVAPWQPAGLEHLLSLGAQFPEEQSRGPIVALGTLIVLSKSVNFPMLQNIRYERALSVTDEQAKWEPTYSFLAYR